MHNAMTLKWKSIKAQGMLVFLNGDDSRKLLPVRHRVAIRHIAVVSRCTTLRITYKHQRGLAKHLPIQIGINLRLNIDGKLSTLEINAGRMDLNCDFEHVLSVILRIPGPVIFRLCLAYLCPRGFPVAHVGKEDDILTAELLGCGEPEKCPRVIE